MTRGISFKFSSVQVDMNALTWLFVFCINTYFCDFPSVCKSTFNFPLIMVLQKLVHCISRGCWYTNMSQHYPVQFRFHLLLGFNSFCCLNVSCWYTNMSQQVWDPTLPFSILTRLGDSNHFVSSVNLYITLDDIPICPSTTLFNSTFFVLIRFKDLISPHLNSKSIH